MKRATSTEGTEVGQQIDCDIYREPVECWKCSGQGSVIVCCDDLCHGQGWCMHGDDGEEMCSVCEGEGCL